MATYKTAIKCNQCEMYYPHHHNGLADFACHVINAHKVGVIEYYEDDPT